MSAPALPRAEKGAGAEALGSASALAELSEPASAAGDSLTVAAWTILSRVTGLARVAVVAAVLGPTYTGNTYQFTNSLPNLLYYGFLAGGLFSSLLAPALVRHIDAWQLASLGAGGWWLPGRDARGHGGDHPAGDHPRTASAEGRGLRGTACDRCRRGPSSGAY